jgi:hypothetical protein
MLSRVALATLVFTSINRRDYGSARSSAPSPCRACPAVFLPGIAGFATYNPAICLPKKPTIYSITSSVRASNVGAMSNPNAFAVLRLIISSNFAGCSTGRSAGLSPLSIRPT